jgi:urea transporter
LAALGIYLWRPSLLLPILAALVSVPLTEIFPKLLGIPALTAPFVLACWLLIAIGCLERRFPTGCRKDRAAWAFPMGVCRK